MKAHGMVVKQYLAHTIAPAAKRVKEVHNILEQRVDVAFGSVLKCRVKEIIMTYLSHTIALACSLLTMRARKWKL